MNPFFTLIDDLAKFLEPIDLEWFVSGGWAIDIHLDRITRERCDLDISVPYSARFKCIQFFLHQDWQIEGKLFDSFKSIYNLSDYTDEIHYFWGFPKDANFVTVYFDENGNRRISYNRDSQYELDFIEVFFDRIEAGYFIYRRENYIMRHVNRAILKKGRLQYLAPEIVLLFKSNRLSKKNIQDFDIVVDSLDHNALVWLIEALSLTQGNSHPWLEKLQDQI